MSRSSEFERVSEDITQTLERARQQFEESTQALKDHLTSQRLLKVDLEEIGNKGKEAWLRRFNNVVPRRWLRDTAIVCDLTTAGRAGFSLPRDWVDAGISHPSREVLLMTIQTHFLSPEQQAFWLYRSDLSPDSNELSRLAVLYSYQKLSSVSKASDILYILQQGGYPRRREYYDTLCERFVPEYLPKFVEKVETKLRRY